MVIFLIVSIWRQSLGVLRFNTKTRYSASEWLDHDWFKINSKQCEDQSKEKPSENILKNILKYKSVSELRRKAMNILVKTLSSKEINEIRKEFEKIDVDNSGTIEASELSAALEKAGLKLPAEKFNKIFDEVDIDKNHKINYSEFIAATLDVREFLTESKLYHLFRIFDVDNSGYITIENMNEAFSKMDEMKMVIFLFICYSKNTRYFSRGQMWQLYLKNMTQRRTERYHLTNSNKWCWCMKKKIQMK